MSTLLQLVNIAREECAVSGGDLSALSSVTGESLRFKNWTIRAWEEIQELCPDWKWMQSSYSFTTTANYGSYTSAEAGIATRFGWWNKEYCTVYLTAVGADDQTELTWMEYEEFRSLYLTGSQTNSRPLAFTIGLANELLLGPKPESTLYTITGQYGKSPQTLSADADTPELPEQHRIIVAAVKMKYGRYEMAPEVMAEGEREYRRIIASLNNKYRPTIVLDGPLT